MKEVAEERTRQPSPGAVVLGEVEDGGQPAPQVAARRELGRPALHSRRHQLLAPVLETLQGEVGRAPFGQPGAAGPQAGPDGRLQVDRCGLAGQT